MTDLAALLRSASTDKRWEVRAPKPGLRHNATQRLVPHRFPVKNGLSSDEVIVRQIEQGNAFYRMMLKRGIKTFGV